MGMSAVDFTYTISCVVCMNSDYRFNFCPVNFCPGMKPQ